MQSQRPSATPDSATVHTSIESSTLYSTAVSATFATPLPSAHISTPIHTPFSAASVASRGRNSTQEPWLAGFVH